MGGVAGAAICTIISKNYLPYARVLMDSAARWAPEMPRFVILVDRVDEYFDPKNENFTLLLSEDLPIAESSWFHFKYTILELSTAVKPYALEFLFERYGFDKLIYFDPDIKLYSSLDSLLALLDENQIVLTPHLTAAFEDDRRPSELDILQSGAYNLGFIAISRGAESSRLLKWWQAKLYDRCIVDIPRGLFVDQKWMDLIPGMFEGVRILREPGYNVAYWSIIGKKLRWAKMAIWRMGIRSASSISAVSILTILTSSRSIRTATAGRI
jgi:hypothetical protein